MKTKKLLIIWILLIASIAKAQVPQGIPYQAVARNGQGQPLASTNVKVRFSILDSTATGTAVYVESHTTTTSALGLFIANVGMGTASTGTFSSINWGQNYKFLKVELDTTATGNSYIDLGTQQMMSVPYALYAGVAVSSNSLTDNSSNKIFTSNTVFTVPNGVTSMIVEMWGGGGGGGNGGDLSNCCSGVSTGGGGGGSGGYQKIFLQVVSGQVFNIVIGSGGVAGVGGGTTYFGSYSISGGGPGGNGNGPYSGAAGTYASVGGAGVAGPGGNNGSVGNYQIFNGGPGGSGGSGPSGIGFGGGGGGTQIYNSANGLPGILGGKASGGGGGGGARSGPSGGGIGGQGGDGLIILYY